MKVKLTYFKQSGKYYCHEEYETQRENLWEIWEEVEGSPELMKSKGRFYVLVGVPDHPYDHPHLIIPAVVEGADDDKV